MTNTAYNRYLQRAGVAVLFFALLWWQLRVWQLPVVGWVFLMLFLVLQAALWRVPLTRVFGFRARGVLSFIFAGFMGVFLTAVVTGLFVLFWQFGPMQAWWSAFIVTVIAALLQWWSQYVTPPHPRIVPLRSDWVQTNIVPRHGFHIILLLTLLAVSFIWMAGAMSSEMLMNPWAVLPAGLSVLVLLLFVGSGVLIFSKHKTVTVLGIITLVSLLVHSYLALTHVLPWGADVWRHIGFELRLAAGQVVQPVLFGPFATWKEVFGVDIPAVFSTPHKYLYNQLWGVSVFIHYITGSALVDINRWFGPILWSVSVPALLFRLGRRMFGSWRVGLLLGWLSLMPFTWQALGAFSLPNTLGFVFFLWFFLLFVQYVQERHPAQRRVLSVVLLGLSFGYTVYAVLAWMFVLLSWVLPRVLERGGRVVRRVVQGVGAVLGLFVFPLLDAFAAPHSIVWRGVSSITQAIGQLTGWFYASQIRPHDIASANIWLNHIPADVFIPLWANLWRWHVLGFLLLVWGMIAYALYRILRYKQAQIWQLMWYVAAMVLGGYVVGWYMTHGEHLFVRRLDPVVALLMLLLFVFACIHLRFHGVSRRVRVALLLFFVLFVSWSGVSVYTSGPDSRVLDKERTVIAKHIVAAPSTDTCVLADQWTLLAIEAVSAHEIVGGGFPITTQFEQTAMQNLYEQLQRTASTSTVAQIAALTGAESCVVALPKERTSPGSRAWFDAHGERQVYGTDKLYIWTVHLNRE